MSHRISILGPRGETMSVVAAGQGRPLVLLHGFPLDHRMWRNQLDELSNDYHVIAPEFRGFGDSTLSSPGFTLGELADDVEWVRRHLATEQSIILCGLSMGGYVAFEYWAKYADNLAGLVLANTKPTADDAGARQTRLDMGQRALNQGTPAAIHGMLEKLLGSASRQHSDLLSDIESMMLDVPPATIMAAQSAMSTRRDFTPELARIGTMTLVITGDEDPIAPPAATCNWAASLPDSVCRVLDAAGHLTPLEAPHAFNEAILQVFPS